MKHSPIDELYNELFGEFPNKAGTALERLATIAYNEICAQRTMVDQRLKGTYSDTNYQLDGLAERDGHKEMIEAKDYSLADDKVGRDDIQKLAGALIDLDSIHGGVFASATEYTQPAIDYAVASERMPGGKHIDLYQVRNSTELDEQGRVKTIHVEFQAYYLEFDKGTYKPVFTKDGKDGILKDYPNGAHIAYHIAEFTDADGNVVKTIEELSRQTNKELSMQTEVDRLKGSWDVKGLYIRFPNGKLYEMARVDYEIPVCVLKDNFDITRDGTPCLLIKSQDGSINTLLTDEQLKKYHFTEGGNVEKY